MGLYYDKLRALRDEHENLSGFQNSNLQPQSRCKCNIIIVYGNNNTVISGETGGDATVLQFGNTGNVANSQGSAQYDPGDVFGDVF